MLVIIDGVRVVAEATTEKDLVHFLGDELDLTPALCCVGGIPWVEIWADFQVLLDVLE